MDQIELFRACLGVLSTAQLLHTGITRSAIRRALAAGRVQRLRRGWYGQQPHPDAIRAIALGGCVSCMDALQHHGAWRPRDKREHVRVSEERRRTRGSRGRARVGTPRQRPRHTRCRPYGANPPVAAALDDLEIAFRCALRCADREQLVAIADSLVHRELATLEQLRSWAADAPSSGRGWLDLVRGEAESGTESMVRLRLRALGVAVSIQVRMWRGRRVDILVGDRLIIECDSVAHHTDLEAYERDRRYDRMHVAQGYLVIRLTWQQIHDDWPAVERDILAVIRRGDHRWPRRKPRDSEPSAA
ncbi:type IV toxin-antitoxin system AbiEi family antitoxin domain-containing protein [Agrococcus baldri]|nr:type IV toxin-antitoxin system AbiEi family antitoxin domain-containing protein [Agrococcus baldri]